MTVVDEVAIADPPDPMGPDENAPYGYMIDPGTGDRRPKRSPGKQRRAPRPSGDGASARAGLPPSIEELKAEGKANKGQDQAPGTDTRGRGQRGRDRQEQAEVPPFRAGPIAKGVNRQYRKAGRILRIFDQQVGAALIECATPDPDIEEGESGGTVGEAWEELARTNPRIRGWLLRRLQQGAILGLLMAHAPLLFVLIPRIPWLSRIPWGKVVMALADDGAEQEQQPQQQPAGMPPGMPPMMAGMFAGLTADDMNQVAEMAQRFWPGMPPMPGGPVPVDPEAAANAEVYTMDSRTPGARRMVVVDQLGNTA